MGINKIKEAKSIRTRKDKITFLLKYSPELNAHKKALEEIFYHLEIQPYHLKPDSTDELLAWYKPCRAEYKKRLKALNAFKKKAVQWTAFKNSLMPDPTKESILSLVNSIDVAIQSHLKRVPQKRGRKNDLFFDFFTGAIKNFWKNELGHEKFLYDSGNKHKDLANDFVDDFVLAEYAGKSVGSVIGLSESLRKHSEVRSKRPSRKISKGNSTRN